MNYFFMRHGEAAWQAPSDAERPLTETGILRLRRVLAQNAARLSSVEHIIHSPYLRATQTAQIAADMLGITSLSIEEHWVPESGVTDALATLEAYSDRTVLVVTHNPLVSMLVGAFCEGAGAMPEPFGTGTIARVDAEWPAVAMGTLVWKQ